MKRIAALLFVLAATPVLAQNGSASADPAVSSARSMWMTFSNYIIASAEQMPEADFSYRPVATVRTFGQLVGHVAGSQYMFCAAALGEAPKGESDVEKSVTTKAGLVAAMKESNEYCKRAYAQTDAASAAKTKLFGGDQTRIFALIMNAAHDGEHYGNIVTYLRTKGMVPPSSQPPAGGM